MPSVQFVYTTDNAHKRLDASTALAVRDMDETQLELDETLLSNNDNDIEDDVSKTQYTTHGERTFVPSNDTTKLVFFSSPIHDENLMGTFEFAENINDSRISIPVQTDMNQCKRMTQQEAVEKSNMSTSSKGLIDVSNATSKRNKARIRQLVQMTDSDDDDGDNHQDLSDKEFLETVARRQKEQRKALFSAPIEYHHQESKQQEQYPQHVNQTEYSQNQLLLTQDVAATDNHQNAAINESKCLIKLDEANLFATTQQWDKKLNFTINSNVKEKLAAVDKCPLITGENNLEVKSKFIIINNSFMVNPYHKRGSHSVETVAIIDGDGISTSAIPHKYGSQSNKTKTDNNNTKPTWYEEAFRSSLIDLLDVVPSKCFIPDEQHAGKSQFFEKGVSPSSYNFAQAKASSQLQCKRCFDSASRALARLAIASRHSKRKVNNNGEFHTGKICPSSIRVESSPVNWDSEDFNPPSPRSLPSFMSVMNVYLANTNEFGGIINNDKKSNISKHRSSSQGVFTGQSVHGRSARTVCLDDCYRSYSKIHTASNKSTDSYSSWSLEQLTFGGIELAAQICYQALRYMAEPSCDNFSKNEVGTNRITTNTSSVEKTYEISTACVNSSLEFLATISACLESDIVYFMLRFPLEYDEKSTSLTLFDILLDLSLDRTSSGSLLNTSGARSTLAFLTLSRGLEASHYVARYAASLDPSSCCAAYSSPYSTIIKSGHKNRLDEGGVGWLSAVGRDLGLDLEKKVSTLSVIAQNTYDFILEYDPVISMDEASNSYHDNFMRDKQRQSSKNLNIDTEADDCEKFICHKLTVVKDRMFAAYVEYLSSMIHLGVISGWLSLALATDDKDSHSSTCGRTVEKLCHKLFIVIESRSRHMYAHESTVKIDPGDSDSVIASSISLLILLLPKREVPSTLMSLSESCRQMGGNSGSIDDLLQSPLMKKVIQFGLSFTCTLDQASDHSVSSHSHALSSAIYILSDLALAGGVSAISFTCTELLNDFLEKVFKLIDYYAASSNHGCSISIEAHLVFLLHLHHICPAIVRQCLRRFLEKSNKIDCSSSNSRSSSFVRSLLCLCAHRLFSVSSCASSFLRSLLYGSYMNTASDILSQMILHSFQSDLEGLDSLYEHWVEAAYSFSQSCRQIPCHSIRYSPRLCSLSDILGAHLLHSKFYQLSASAFSTIYEEGMLIDLLAEVLRSNVERCSNRIDALSGSLNLSLISLFNQFVVGHVKDECGISDQQMVVKEKIQIILGSQGIVLTAVESAMIQEVSADFTHRAISFLNRYNSMSFLNSERMIALTFTRSRSFMRQKELSLQIRNKKLESEINKVHGRLKMIELERDDFESVLRDQQLSYEKRLEWVKFDAETSAKNIVEIHAHERLQAERHSLECERLYSNEKEMRISVEENFKTFMEDYNELKIQHSSGKSRIEELERLLEQAYLSNKKYTAALESTKNEVVSLSEKLERSIETEHDLESKLALSEKTVLDLTTCNKDIELNLEKTCEKLINLARFYQLKETEIARSKVELRKAVNEANKNADTAIANYEASRIESHSLRKRLDDTIKELNREKEYRVEIQRLKKNAPTSYINQIRNDPRLQAKPCNRLPGKENSIQK